MKNIHNAQVYNEYLLEKIKYEIFPCYDLWSLRSYQNQRHEFVSGKCAEIEKFSQFISNYSEKNDTPDLLLVIANGEKNYPTVMLNTSKKYMIIKFVNDSEYIGEPLYLPPYFFNK